MRLTLDSIEMNALLTAIKFSIPVVKDEAIKIKPSDPFESASLWCEIAILEELRYRIETLQNG